MKRALILTAAAALMATPALATDIVVENFIGTLTVTEGPAGVEVRRENAKLDVTSADGAIRIDGGIKRPGKEGVCRRGLFGGSDPLGDYPSVAITVPEGSTLRIRNTVARTDVGVGLERGDINVMGCFDTELQDVLTLKAARSGSGDLVARDVGSLSLGSSGSGNASSRDVGTARISKSGSSDVSVRDITRGLELSSSGSGDTAVSRLTGDLTVRTSGSGDLVVGGGEVGAMSVAKSGSTTITVNAPVRDLSVRSSGSGDVVTGPVSGDIDVRTSGSSKVRAGE